MGKFYCNICNEYVDLKDNECPKCGTNWKKVTEDCLQEKLNDEDFQEYTENQNTRKKVSFTEKIDNLCLLGKTITILSFTCLPMSFFFLLLYPVVGIIILILGVVGIYKGINMKPPFSTETVDYMVLLSLIQALMDNKNEYLNYFKESDTKNNLNKLYSQLALLSYDNIRKYASRNLMPSKPINPYTAAGIGSAFGGTAGALISYSEAKANMENYEENLRIANETHYDYEVSLDKLKDCYHKIEEILETNEKVKNSWNKLQEDITDKKINELKEDYRISNFL